MKQDSRFEPLPITKITSNFLHPLNTCVLSFEHTVGHLQPYRIQYSPKIITYRIPDFYHGLQPAAAEPAQQLLSSLLCYAHVRIVPEQ